MQNQQHPDFKSGFKYSNIGNIVGTLNYAKEMKKKDGVTSFGIEFLINAKGFGSINVRIPMMDRAQNSLDNFPVSDKPRVRAGLSRIEQFTSDAGKTYTNATTFVELSEAKTASGDDMKDNIAGRVGGEIFGLQQIQGDNGPAVKFSVVTYSTDKDDANKRATTANGTPVDPQVLTFEAHDPEVVHQIQQTVTNGANVEVGYRYFNKSNIQYDVYGFAINGGNSDVIERLEAGKIVVHSGPLQQQNQGFGNNQGGFGGNQGGFGGQQQQQQQQGNPFGNQQNNQQQGFGNQQGGFGGQQQQQQQQGNPFGNQQQQQGNPFGDPNQYQMPDNQIPFTNEYQQHNDPFAGAQELPKGSPAYEEAQRMFGNQGGNGFGFGN